MIRPAILALSALSLAGCATGSRLTPEQGVALMDAFSRAGCKGMAAINAGAATGQVGGEAHISVTASGDCDPARAASPASGTARTVPAADPTPSPPEAPPAPPTGA